MTNYDKKYQTGSKKESLIYSEADMIITNEKEAKFYSNNDREMTVRKKLIDQYPKKSQNASIFTGKDERIQESTKSHGIDINNENLIDRFQSNILSYRPKFQQKIELKKVDYTPIDLSQKFSFQKSPPQKYVGPESKPELKSELKKRKLILQSEESLRDLLPLRHTNKVDSEISSLYKENRDVNLEYRRQKFFKIFVGKQRKSSLFDI